MKGTKAKPKEEKSFSSGGSMTHSQMNIKFKSLGSNVANKAKNDPFKLKDYNKIVKVRSLNLNKDVIIKGVYKIPESFGSYYRRRSKGQDEFFPTSAMREFIAGAAGGPTLNPKALATMEDVINEISSIRFPTNWTGFARGSGTGADRMQHPTTPGKGMWRISVATDDGNPHSELDRARKEAILIAMNDKVGVGSNLQTIINAGIARAITFTLNEFLAPAAAKDQFPSTINMNERIDQTLLREKLKPIAIMCGAKQDKKGDNSIYREYGIRQGMRSLSPPRKNAVP
jgi:hypothetical protein